MGAGNGIRLASLPAVLLLTPWGTFTRELVRLALEHSGRTSARAGNRVAGGGSAVTLQRDAAEVHACRRAARAYRREPGHGRARQPAEHRSSQCEAPLTAPAVVGASPCERGGSPSPLFPARPRGHRCPEGARRVPGPSETGKGDLQQGAIVCGLGQPEPVLTRLPRFRALDAVNRRFGGGL
jgi:hypothetical protein